MPAQLPTTLSGSNRIVRAYVSASHALAQESSETELEEDMRAKAAVAILISVSSVEAYVNIFARLLLAQDPDFTHAERIRSDLRAKKSLLSKLQYWPQLFFGKSIDFGKDIGQKFRALLDQRNRLMHFSSESHEFEFENVIIKGLVDTTVFDNLTAQDAEAAAITAEEFIEHLLRLQGLPEENIPHALHHWVGRPPRDKVG